MDPGYWIEDPGSRIRDPGSWTQDPGSRILDPGSWIQDLGSTVFLVIGSALLRGSKDAEMGVKSNALKPLLPVGSDSSLEANLHFPELSHNTSHNRLSNLKAYASAADPC